MCSSKEEKLDGAKYDFLVKAYEKDGIIDWCLLVSSFNYIPDNAILLLKLGNSDILNIPINNLHIGKINMPSFSYMVGNIALTSPSGTADHYCAIFSPTSDQWLDIEKHGIIKVRISSHSSFNEKSWKKDKLGKYIEKSRQIIKKRLTTTTVKSIYTDF